MYEIVMETRDEETFNMLRDLLDTIAEYAEDTDREHLMDNFRIDYRFDDLDMSWDVELEDVEELELTDEHAFDFGDDDAQF